MTLQGVIFDLDGTLGDTLPVCYAAFQQTLRTYTGRDYTDADVRATFGPSEEGVFQRIVGDRWEAAMDDFVVAYEHAHVDLACNAPFPGIQAIVELLNQRGIRKAIVTGKGPRSAAVSLRHLDLASSFDIVEAGQASGNVKVEAIRTVLAAWDIGPAGVAYVGDAPSDVTAARAADTLAVSVAWAPVASEEELAARGPDALFTTVAAFAAWLDGQTRH